MFIEVHINLTTSDRFPILLKKDQIIRVVPNPGNGCKIFMMNEESHIPACESYEDVRKKLME